MYAVGIGPGDEVIVPPMTFAATANAAVYLGGVPVFADVEPGTLLLDPAEVKKKITARTKAIAAVDYAGQPCDYDALRSLAREHGIALLSDGCHALGAEHRGQRVGSMADLTAFSFHPVKHITTGEGGMITTNDDRLAARMRTFRNHGITTDHRQRSEHGSWFYEMVDLGFNYRITDFQCALGSSQLRKLPVWLKRRREIAARYDAAFASNRAIHPLTVRPGALHAYHLYVVQVDGDRQTIFQGLRERGIGANVHYIPVHLHPFYRQRFGTGPGLCPVAEAAYERILSLPMFPRMSNGDVDQVVADLSELVG
jgi:perosamine synthetase